MALHSFAILPVLLSVALAQSPQSPLIPAGISSGCSSFLASLNNNPDVISCTQPFTVALEQFAPGASPSSSAVNSALNTLCGDGTFSACPQSTVTTQLSSFYAACSNELTASPNQLVKTNYDALYSLVPLRQVLCSKDDNGNYCATELSNSSRAGSIALVDSAGSQKQSQLAQYLYMSPEASGTPTRRDTSNQTNVNQTSIYIANATTFQNSNILYLFLEPSMSNSELCTTCTRNTLTPFITFESNCPYAPGMSNSLLLPGQTSLYNNVTSKCGSSFLSGAVQAAGGLSSGLLSSAASRARDQEFSAAVSAILGVAAFMAASL